MKRKFLISTALAVVLVVALAATAFAATIQAPASADQGDTITVTFSTSEQGFAGVIHTTGLEYVDNNSGGISTATKVVVVGVSSDTSPISVTYTYRVVGDPGSVATISVSDAVESNGATENDITVQPASIQINGVEPTPSPSPSESPSQTPSASPSPSQTASGQPTDQPSGQPTGSASLNPSAQPSGSVSAKPSGSVKPARPTSVATGKDKMPKTGDTSMDLWTLVVIGAACAAVAIVAGRKAFSHR